MPYSGFLLGSGEEHTDVAFAVDFNPFCNMDFRIKSLLVHITSSQGLLFLSKVLVSPSVPRVLWPSYREHFVHGLPAWWKWPRSPKVDTLSSNLSYIFENRMSVQFYAYVYICVLYPSSHVRVSYSKRKWTLWWALKSVEKIKTLFQ